MTTLFLAFYLDTDLTDLISGRDIFHTDILDRKITEYSRLFIDEMSMGVRIALIVSFTIDPGKSPEHPLFCHSFDIAVDGRATDLRTSFLHFFIDILGGEMSTFTGIADDVTILVLAHDDIMRKNLTKANFGFLILHFSIYSAHATHLYSRLECT
jgi:hypothetical protein